MSNKKSEIPKFFVPQDAASELKGDIFLGTILNPEREPGYYNWDTPFEYRIEEENLVHTCFTGTFRCGKTVAAMRFVAELTKIRRKKTGKRLRIVALDTKENWRMLAQCVEPERFHFYSIGNPEFRPLCMNPWKIPKGLYPKSWINSVIYAYCNAYGFLEHEREILQEIICELYEEAGVFKAREEKKWEEKVSELSSKVNFIAIRDAIVKAKEKAKDSESIETKAYDKFLKHFSCFFNPYSVEYQLYGTAEGASIDELIDDDDVTVLESQGLESAFKNFIFSVITSGFCNFALAHEGGYLAEDQYETVLVVEDANEIMFENYYEPNTAEQFGFEQILAKPADYGLFLFTITQRISEMSPTVMAHTELLLAGKLLHPGDISVATHKIQHKEDLGDEKRNTWFSETPLGWFTCIDNEKSVLVRVKPLNLEYLSNIAIDNILEEK